MNNFISVLVSILIFFSLASGHAQKYDISKLKREITLTQNDTTVIFYIYINNPELETDMECNYYWYFNNAIGSNQGGFIGNLLDGPYVVFASNNKLIEKGNFANGIKEGVWTKWYNNGNIEETSNWKDGKLNGTTRSYNTTGKLLRTSQYKNNFLHGKQIQYYRNDTITNIYKNGLIVNKTPKNIFKIKTPDKKDKKTDSNTKSDAKKKKNNKSALANNPKRNNTKNKETRDKEKNTKTKKLGLFNKSPKDD